MASVDTDYKKHPQYLLLRLAERRLLPMSDKAYLKMRYKEIFNRKLDLKDPKTFNEKMQWMKLYDRKDLYITLVDKYEAKSFVADTIGEDYIIPTLGVYDSFDDVNFDKLPDQFALKCTHNSGNGMLICRDKSKIDFAKERKRIKKALKENFFYMSREWPYKKVKPRIIIEKYMGDDLVDYRFYCFNGEVGYIYQYLSESQEDYSKPEPRACNIYDRNWVLQPFHQASKPSTEKYARPKLLSKMIKLAEKLARNLDFVRVDLYVIDGKIYFGEMTLLPGGGFSQFHPEKYDLEMGKKLKLPLQGAK